MTTYVLHGGQTKIKSEDNEQFYGHFTDLVLKDRVKILLCYWAREKDNWVELFEKDKLFIKAQTKKKVDVILIDTIESLRNGLKDADVLYVSGGEENLLRPYMSQLGFLKDALKDKVYLGSSMGAFMVSTYYVLSFTSQDVGKVYSGLGLIPYNSLCHWNVEKYKNKKIAMLKEKNSQTPILLIEEQRFEKIII